MVDYIGMERIRELVTRRGPAAFLQGLADYRQKRFDQAINMMRGPASRARGLR